MFHVKQNNLASEGGCSAHSHAVRIKLPINASALLVYPICKAIVNKKVVDLSQDASTKHPSRGSTRPFWQTLERLGLARGLERLCPVLTLPAIEVAPKKPRKKRQGHDTKLDEKLLVIHHLRSPYRPKGRSQKVRSRRSLARQRT